MLTDPGAVPRHASPIPTEPSRATLSADSERGSGDGGIEDTDVDDVETSRLTSGVDDRLTDRTDGISNGSGGAAFVGAGGTMGDGERGGLGPAGAGRSSKTPPVKWCHKCVFRFYLRKGLVWYMIKGVV